MLAVLLLAFKYGHYEEDTPTSTTPKVVQEVPKITYAFDIPSLIGKDLPQVREALKGYEVKTLELTKEQIAMGNTTEWDASFKKDGQELLVTYTIATNKVIDLFISTDDKNGLTRDKKHLLEVGNLKEGDSRYQVEFVKAMVDSKSFTGVKITAK